MPEDWGGYNVGFITGKHRGVAIYGENIYFLSNDAKLHAINYKTGAKVFVKDYQADGFPYPKDFAKAKDATGYAITVGPMAIPGQIIVPMNGTDFGGLPGYVLGVDPASGNIQWKAAMIPGAGEPGADTWPEGSTKYGGAGPWISGSWDPELKMYYTGTANAYEWNPRNRGGGELDNLGAASIVAVDTTSGKVPWRYVAVPGDPFDYDVPQTPMVITIDGKKTVVQPNKTGYIHYLDAKTGKYLRAVPFVEKIDWAQGYDAKGRPIDMAPVPKEGGAAVELWPSLLGGVNMYPNAYSPKTGDIYLAATNSGMKYGLEEIKVISNVRHFGAYQEFIFGNEMEKAVNVKTGQQAWRNDVKGPGLCRRYADDGRERDRLQHAGRRIHGSRRNHWEDRIPGQSRHGGEGWSDHLQAQRQADVRAGARRHARVRARRSLERGVRKHGGRVPAGVRRRFRSLSRSFAWDRGAHRRVCASFCCKQRLPNKKSKAHETQRCYLNLRCSRAGRIPAGQRRDCRSDPGGEPTVGQ